ncbi:MAG: type II toxin-antitoxin system VapB family antitoxin [Chthoniobacteraceae bacterium]
MKTTVDIPEKELRDAMRFTKAKTKKEAIVKALEDFNQRRRMSELTKHFGTFDSLLTNDEIEEMETSDSKSWTKGSRSYPPKSR